jgi:hypothetical protein
LVFTLGISAVSIAQPLAWWKFDEASGSTAFATAGGVNGTLNGAANFASGISGNAIQLSQVGGGYVNFGNNFGLLGTSYTISFWMNSTSTATDQVFLGKHRATVTSGYFVGMSKNGPYGSPNKAWMYQSSGPGNQPISTTSVNDGSWHHIAIAYNLVGGSHSIYVDGGLAESTTTASPMISTVGDFIVGGVSNSSMTGALTLYTGLIDDVQIYTSRLSDAEVGFLHANPGAAVPDPATMTVMGMGIVALARRRRR